MVSCSFLRTCPEAEARTTSPTRAIELPTMSESRVGRASQRYTPAKTNPSGTRMRRAMVCQLGMRCIKHAADRQDDFLGADADQTRVRAGGVRQRCPAGRISQ